MNLCRLAPVVVGLIIIIMTSVVWRLSLVVAGQVSVDVGEDLQIEVVKKRASKQVVTSQGAKE